VRGQTAIIGEIERTDVDASGVGRAKRLHGEGVTERRKPVAQRLDGAPVEVFDDHPAASAPRAHEWHHVRPPSTEDTLVGHWSEGT
jgi:hypothetical protein